MKQFISFVKKEFYHVFRDKRTMLIVLGMPIVQIILFGFAISTEVKNINVAVLVPTQDEMTRQIIERIDASEYFSVKDILTSKREIDPAFQSGKVNFVIALSPHFADHLFTKEGSQIQLITDATETNTATSVAMYSSNIIQSYFSEKYPSGQTPGIKPNLRLLYNPQMKSAYSFVPGVMGLIIILICAMMTSISIVREKETGTMEILLVSPIRPIYIIFSKMVPYFALSCVSFIFILLLSVYVLGVPIQGSLIALCSLSLLYIIVALSLGLLISTLTRSQITAMLISGMMLMFPIIFFSGMMFPIENMPKVFQWFSNIIPAYWYISGVKKLMIEGLSTSYVIKEFAVLTTMAVLLITISLKNFKYRLE